jgi:hypothetical protein
MQHKWLFICIALGALLLALVLATQGFTAWTAILAVALLVCPLLGLWVMRRYGNRAGGDTREGPG